MSVLRDKNTSREDYTYNNNTAKKKTESGTEIETKTSGLLSCSNIMINVQRTSQRTDLHSNACGCTVIITVFCQMCNSA